MAIDQSEETSPSTSKNDQLAIDTRNALYIHPYDNPIINLVLVLFDGI